MEREPSTRKPPGASRRPPVMPPAPPSGTVLDYHQPKRKKSLPRRIINHIRFHYEDRLGNVIMWIVGPIIIVLFFLLQTVGVWARIFRLMLKR